MGNLCSLPNSNRRHRRHGSSNQSNPSVPPSSSLPNSNRRHRRHGSSNQSNPSVPPSSSPPSSPPSSSPPSSKLSDANIFSDVCTGHHDKNITSSFKDKKTKYSIIPDNFKTLDQVTAALIESGLESSNLILGIDFTKSNEWTGNVSFNKRSLHAIGDTPNPYEKAISIIGKTLAPFANGNLIPCFGFGDVTTRDQEVFSFHSDHTPCNGFEEVLVCYRNVVPNLKLSVPTSFAPVIDAAIDIVKKSSDQYHVLVIIADGQIGESSPQEEKTIESIVTASSHPLSIVLIGVGDGPWEDMQTFEDKIPAREFDNFQFVNFTAIMSKNITPAEKDAAFAHAALMEISTQYKAARDFGILRCKTRKIVPRPPPVPYTHGALQHVPSDLPSPAIDDQTQACPICLTNAMDMAFNCGHMTCRECSTKVSNCPICRQRITNRLRLFA